MEKDEGILTVKRDSSSGWPQLEVEGAAGLVSSPRSLSFLHMSPGSVYLVTCSESIQNHSSDIKKCRFVFMSGTRGKNNNIFLYLCFFFSTQQPGVVTLANADLEPVTCLGYQANQMNESGMIDCLSELINTRIAVQQYSTGCVFSSRLTLQREVLVQLQ